VIKTAIMLALLGGAVLQDAAKPGAAIVIGGGGDQPAIVKRIIELSGGADARILVLPISTSSTENPGRSMASFFQEHGAKNVGIWIPKSKEEADGEASLAALKAARGFYFGGGDQKRGMNLLHGTKALEVIRKAHRGGAAVAGSSAGAALMARVMIDGAPVEGPISPGKYATSEGLGVTGNWVTDQHFLQRGRMQRLINVLLDNPGYRGVGVDERTAAVFVGDTLEVIGQGQVVLVEPPVGVSSRPTESRPLYRADEVRIRVLATGDRLKL
jgi:cyanophycinase